jgi:hypothetical protein
MEEQEPRSCRVVKSNAGNFAALCSRCGWQSRFVSQGRYARRLFEAHICLDKPLAPSGLPEVDIADIGLVDDGLVEHAPAIEKLEPPEVQRTTVGGKVGAFLASVRGGKPEPPGSVFGGLPDPSEHSNGDGSYTIGGKKILGKRNAAQALQRLNESA